MSAYVDRLNAAWADHLAPRALDAPTVISTFAGCGGSSLGYSMAGFRELLAVEWDQNAVDTFRLNFPDVSVYHGDIAELSVDECLRLSGLAPGELAVLDGSPPCQGFSTAGKRDMNDDRNQLFREFVRLLRGLLPRVFVMENVSGMVKGKMKLVFVEILRELKASGYRVSARMLKAMYFGVPQSRERMIFIGVRNDLDIEPSHPTAATLPQFVNQVFPEVRSVRSYGAGYEIRWLDSNRAHPTLQADAAQKPTRWLIGDEECRPSSAQLSAVASFPREFVWAGTADEVWKRIGNSVPPLFMRAISEHIRTHILDAEPALQRTAAG